MNGLLLEEAPLATAGETCSFDNYLALPDDTMDAVGTEIHLVNRLAKRFAPLGKRVITLDESGCLCTTMYRISPQHLAWTLENLVEGRVVNRIWVENEVKHWAHVALDRMLEIGN